MQWMKEFLIYPLIFNNMIILYIIQCQLKLLYESDLRSEVKTLFILMFKSKYIGIIENTLKFQLRFPLTNNIILKRILINIVVKIVLHKEILCF